MANANLFQAKEAKFDEFYTELSDIQSEMNNYPDKFKGKVVFCNCDDPLESNFVKYFLMNFNRLGLKELIATGYKTSSVGGADVGTTNTPYALRVKDTSKYLAGTQKDLDIRGAKCLLETEGDKVMTPLVGNFALDDNGQPIQITVKEPLLDNTGNAVLDKKGKPKTKSVKQNLYYEAGDFRSDMSIALLKASDIVVTNPPFSLFREYVAQLIKYKKSFIILGHNNSITYKEIFPLFQNNQMWLGALSWNKELFFNVSKEYENYLRTNKKEGSAYRIINGEFKARAAVMWYTNIDLPKRHQILPLDLGYTYEGHEDMYPKYDNFDAINIAALNEIPNDYTGVMGVPVSFIDKYCPAQFKLIACTNVTNESKGELVFVHDKSYYKGYVRGKVVTNLDATMPIMASDICGGTKCHRNDGDPILYQLYHRIFIKFTDEYINAHPEQFRKEGIG
jgi:hypothetical protein